MATDSDWWWHYALDGVVGSIIGGLVTLLVLWLTVRHERRRTDAQRVQDQALALLQRSQRLARECAVTRPQDQDAHMRIYEQLMLEWTLEAELLAGRARDRYPALAAAVTVTVRTVRSAVPRSTAFEDPRVGEEVADTLSRLIGTLQSAAIEANAWEGKSQDLLTIMFYDMWTDVERKERGLIRGERDEVSTEEDPSGEDDADHTMR